MADQTNNDVDDLLARIKKLEALLARRTDDDASRADIWFLLDRSGSMRSIAEYVVQGFDEFIAEQRKEAGEAAMTLVQFDNQDLHDVLVDAAPLSGVTSIAGRFQPRGQTPLYDAIAAMLDRAEKHLGDSEGDPADQLVVIMTDGGENSSRRFTAPEIFERIEGLRRAGWTFVYLGANQDSYSTGSVMGVVAGNTSNFTSSRSSVLAAHSGLTRTVSEWRSKPRSARIADGEDFWNGVKEGEKDGAG